MIVKPWCNYSTHRTTSKRKAAGMRSARPVRGASKRRHYRAVEQWWAQADPTWHAAWKQGGQ